MNSYELDQPLDLRLKALNLSRAFTHYPPTIEESGGVGGQPQDTLTSTSPSRKGLPPIRDATMVFGNFYHHQQQHHQNQYYHHTRPTPPPPPPPSSYQHNYYTAPPPPAMLSQTPVQNPIHHKQDPTTDKQQLPHQQQQQQHTQVLAQHQQQLKSQQPLQLSTLNKSLNKPQQQQQQQETSNASSDTSTAAAVGASAAAASAACQQHSPAASAVANPPAASIQNPATFSSHLSRPVNHSFSHFRPGSATSWSSTSISSDASSSSSSSSDATSSSPIVRQQSLNGRYNCKPCGIVFSQPETLKAHQEGYCTKTNRFNK